MAFLTAIFESIYHISFTQAVIAVALVLLCIYYCFLENKGIPPGPTGIPFLGYFPFLRQESIHLQMQELRNKYGEIFSLKVTNHVYICLSSSKVIKEAHLGQSDCFADRFSSYSLIFLTFEEGLAAASGESWKIQRKFFQQKFREYGMIIVKEAFSDSVHNILNDVVEEMRDLDGKPFSIRDLMTLKSARVIRRILFSDQGITNEELLEMNKEYNVVLGTTTFKNMFLSGHLARYLVLPFMPSYWAMLRSHRRIQSILWDVIHTHKKNFDETQVVDLIDSYYKEKKDRERKGDPTAKYFTDKALLSSVYQFLTDGVLTVGLFMGIFFAKLTEYPEEQEKIYKELLDVLGPDRQPTIEDRSNLPYTNAFIYEVIRCTDFLALHPSLKCTKETTLRGYRIPKDALTIINNWVANHDPNLYENPHTFNPSRYISTPERKRAELPQIFGTGKRACLGEPFALIQVFLFMSTFVKNFQLKKPEGVKNSSTMAGGDVLISAHYRAPESGIKLG